jgi:N-methylhydantoinase A/oxoprolinase/acetone carboxylase beta subunit
VRIGVDVGGTNTDAVLMDGREVLAWTKQPTTADVSSGVAAAIGAVLAQSSVSPADISAVMIGTTHFTNALVQRQDIDRVGILRLSSPAAEALPPLTGWPADLADTVKAETFLLPGGYEVDGREIAPFDEARVRAAARALRDAGIASVAISSAFASVNSTMEDRAAAVVREEYPGATISLSSAIGRIGFIERENAVLLNAALTSLATRVISSFERALVDAAISAPLYISQNDGTLISAEQAAAHPVLTIGSGPTNSMRGAAFLTGVRDAIVMDVGGTTTDIGVLGNGFPRESSVSVDIGGVRTNFRMPDILAIGLGGGTRINLDPLRVGPDSVGFRITEDALIFGGATLTASDIAVASGWARFGEPERLPAFAPEALAAVQGRIRAIMEEGVDRMKTTSGDATILAVGGGNFMIPDNLKGAGQVIRPEHAAVANAVGAAIAQVGAEVDQIVNYDRIPRETTLNQLRRQAGNRVVAGGGDPETVEVVEVDEVFLSYLPGRSAQVRIKAVGDLALGVMS